MLDVDITTIGVEVVVMPTIDLVKRGILIRSTTNWGSGLSGVLVRRKMSGSSTLPTSTNKVVGTP